MAGNGVTAGASLAVVSGGTGFVGRFTVAALRSAGFEVVVLSSGPDTDARADQPRLLSTERPSGDLVERLVELTPDVFVHLAAVGGATHEVTAVQQMINVNIGLGSSMLEAASLGPRNRAPARFVATGTFWQRSRDHNGMHANSLYAATKSALEAIAEFYAAERAVPSTFLHLTDVYGPGDRRQRLLNAVAHAVVSRETLEMSKGEQVVSFVHATDVADAIVHVAQPNVPQRHPCPEVWSVRGPSVMPLRATIEQLATDLDIDIPIDWGRRPYRGNEVMQPDFGKLLAGWEPAVLLSTGFLSLLEEAA